ncbi:hypothetical protein AVEN_208940-1 [Araneus ventricosus]|uniref:Retrotransposon gag domain-containing protein n=1 Tax=Araneus ventricosus TaxID=182803 RepID=A0A4Y2HPE1_ARAVE|nr:hypothetical protein AVEN_208940-1 [Araneus ventricosus]
MPGTGPLARSMDKQFEKLFVMMAEMKAGQEEMRVAQAGLEQKREAGQAGLEQKMEAGQEEMQSGQERISTNGWTDFVKASQLVASLRGSAAEVLKGIPAGKLTDPTTIKKALESRFGDSYLTQFYRTELKTRRRKPGQSLQELAADVERLMSLAYAESPLDIRESLAVQFFVDAIRDEETQLSTRLMDFTDLKSALAYSMKFESAKTASKVSIHARSIEIEDDIWKERDDKFESLGIGKISEQSCC